MDETAALAASMPTAAPDPVTPTAPERRSQASYARRQARYEEAVRLKAMGMPLKRIAATIGVECSATIKTPLCIASPEMLPSRSPLPHLTTALVDTRGGSAR